MNVAKSGKSPNAAVVPLLPTQSCQHPGSATLRAACGMSCRGAGGPDERCVVIARPTAVCSRERFDEVNEVILRIAVRLNAHPRALAWPGAQAYFSRGARMEIRDLRRRSGELPAHKRAGYCGWSAPAAAPGIVRCTKYNRDLAYDESCGKRCPFFTPRHREELPTDPDGRLPDVPQPENIDESSLIAQVSALLGELTEIQARVLRMYFGLDGKEWSIREIARALGKSEAWVQATIRKALDALKRRVID